MQASARLHREDNAGSPHVLVVDDDPEIGLVLSRYLGGQGLRVSTAGNGNTLWAVLDRSRIDLVLLDLGLPDEDGLVLMRQLRTRWRGPVIIVSGRGESVERIVGLELGADDYVTKPFELRELLARIRSVLRRSRAIPAAAEAASSYAFAGFLLNVPSRELTGPDGQHIPLTTGEFALLLALIRQARQVVSRDQLMNALHGRDAGPYGRAIDVQIGRLRRKLEVDPADPQLIKSVRGAGYLFTAAIRVP